MLYDSFPLFWMQISTLADIVQLCLPFCRSLQRIVAVLALHESLTCLHSSNDQYSRAGFHGSADITQCIEAIHHSDTAARRSHEEGRRRQAVSSSTVPTIKLIHHPVSRKLNSYPMSYKIRSSRKSNCRHVSSAAAKNPHSATR